MCGRSDYSECELMGKRLLQRGFLLPEEASVLHIPVCNDWDLVVLLLTMNKSIIATAKTNGWKIYPITKKW